MLQFCTRQRFSNISYDKPLLKEFITTFVIIDESHLSVEIIIYKNKIKFTHRKNNFPVGHQDFPTGIEELPL